MKNNKYYVYFLMIATLISLYGGAIKPPVIFL